MPTAQQLAQKYQEKEPLAPEEIFKLADAYNLGQGIYQNKSLAIELYKSAFLAGQIKAADELRLIVLSENNQEALDALTSAAANHWEAKRCLAMIYIKGTPLVAQNLPKAIQLLEDAYIDSERYYKTHQMHELHSPNNLLVQLAQLENQIALAALRKIAKIEGESEAPLLLGDILFNSQEQAELKEAVAMLELAIKNGNTDAAFKLAVAYKQGKGSAIDLDKSATYYLLALNNYNGPGAYNETAFSALIELARVGNNNALQGLETFVKERPHNLATRLSNLYENGSDGLRKNSRKATEILQSVEDKCMTAKYELAKKLFTGKGVAKNQKQACDKFKALVTSEGHELPLEHRASALAILGHALANGKDVKKKC